MDSTSSRLKKPVIFFDGVCNLCNGAVNTVIDLDKKGQFMFASLQSEEAKEILEPYPVNPNELNSIVLLKNGEIFEKSSAVLQISKLLPFPIKALSYFRFIPLKIRDIVYDLIARNRYKWFGKKNECRIPTPELKARFLHS